MTTAVDRQLRLADELVGKGSIRSRWLHRAFAEIPREVFVPRFHRSSPDGELVAGADPAEHAQWLDEIYSDRVLIVQYRAAPAVASPGIPTSSSSMPTVMAGMLEALELQPGHRVLEIGTGTGYNTALLCHRVGDDNVTSIELDPTLADAARDALTSLGLHPTIRAGDGAVGLAEAAPFDRILATASTDHLPPAWITQLAQGGAIVTDLRGSLAGGIIRLTPDIDPSTGSDTEIDAEVETVSGRFLDLPGAFMPMRTRADRALRDGEDWDSIVYDHINPHHGTTEIDPAQLADNPSLGLLTQLHLAGHRTRGFTRSFDNTQLSGTDIDGSWFSVNLTPDHHGRYIVTQGGPHRLWDTLEVAHTTWKRLGTPGVERFGITANDECYTQHVWFDHPDSGYRWPLPL